VATGEKGMEKLHKKWEHGIQNGAKDLCILSREELLAMEPNLNPEVIAALYAPTAGVVNPWEFGLAAVENAVDNGARLFLKTEVTGIEKRREGWRIRTTKGSFRVRYVINCAGLYADAVSAMANEPYFTIKPRRGEYFILDTPAKDLVSHVIFNAHEEDEKGGIVVPTVHGNIMVGPTASDTEDKEDFTTSRQGLEALLPAVSKSVIGVPFALTIRSFAGIRPRPNWLRKNEETGAYENYEDDVKDFIIGEQEEGFFDVAGIKSPGLTCADEIGKYVAELVTGRMDNPLPNPDFNPRRRERIRFASLSPECQADLVAREKTYGKIVCRCRKVTEAEVVDAIRRNAGATSVDGVKRRAGTCLGRCQGAYCTEEILRILSRELGIPVDQIEKDQGNAPFISGLARQTTGEAATQKMEMIADE